MGNVRTLDQVTFYFHPRYQRNLKADVIEALKVKKDLLKQIPAEKVNLLLKRNDLTDLQIDKKVDAIIEFFENENNFNRVIRK